MKRFLTLLTILFVFSNVQAQKIERISLRGKAYIGTIPAELDEIRIQNLTTNKEVTTLDGGYFVITAKAGDTLMFIGREILPQKFGLTEREIEKDLWAIALDIEGTQLKEVVVKTDGVSTESLGIAKGKKKYTPAERKLATSKNLSGQRDDKTALTRVGTDPLLNAVSGRTASLKKQVAVEKKQAAREKIDELYEPAYFTDQLHIPADYTEGFLFYAVENPQLIKALGGDSKEEIDFQLSKLATSYKKMLESESK